MVWTLQMPFMFFLGNTVEIEDTGKDYGETCIICYGMLNTRIVVVGYVQRGDKRHIFSMWKCHEEEWKKFWF